jgi:hypothetical protein
MAYKVRGMIAAIRMKIEQIGAAAC